MRTDGAGPLAFFFKRRAELKRDGERSGTAGAEIPTRGCVFTLSEKFEQLEGGADEGFFVWKGSRFSLGGDFSFVEETVVCIEDDGVFDRWLRFVKDPIFVTGDDGGRFGLRRSRESEEEENFHEE